MEMEGNRIIWINSENAPAIRSGARLNQWSTFELWNAPFHLLTQHTQSPVHACVALVKTRFSNHSSMQRATWRLHHPNPRHTQTPELCSGHLPRRDQGGSHGGATIIFPEIPQTTTVPLGFSRRFQISYWFILIPPRFGKSKKKSFEIQTSSHYHILNSHSNSNLITYS